MLAEDYVESKLVFPLFAQPKIDGVRGLNQHGFMTGRSLKPFANKYTTEFYSQSWLSGADGELAAAHECDYDLCRKTASALTTIEGTPFTLWWLFDFLQVDMLDWPYEARYEALKNSVAGMLRDERSNYVAQHLRVVESHKCDTLEQLLAWDDLWLEMGYEGTIVRGIKNLHKAGRSTVREGGLLRIKRFIEENAQVMEIEEAETNLNEPEMDLLGRMKRSSHQENKIPKGMLGNMQCKVLKDVIYGGRKLMEQGQMITVGPGEMDHAMRKRLFEHPEDIVGKVITFKFFPKGIKNKPRFPTFKSFRDSVDMSN